MRNFDDLAVPSTAVTIARPGMAQVAEVANNASKAIVLRDYQERAAAQTLRRHHADLDSFASYLDEAGIEPGDLLNDLSAWDGISYGLVEGYKRWMIGEGYAVGTINARLATIKCYVGLAVRAGFVPESAQAMIKMVKGYKPKEAIHLDQKRAVTRRGHKKAKATVISIEQAEDLKNQMNTKDRLLMCLLIDHGFRCGEIAALKVESVNLSTRHILVYRPKVDKEGTQKLSEQALEALEDYLAEYNPTGYLFQGNTTREGIQGSYGVRAINHRVAALGRQLGIDNLSPHDLRHYWAWYAAYRGIPINRLQQAGGWKSLEMPIRYIGSSDVENEGMV